MKRFMKSVNWPKPGYASITCTTISNIPYNLNFTTKFNDSSILITNISCDYLSIDRNFCLVHEEITSIRLYSPCNCGRVAGNPSVCTTWLRLFRVNRSISINPYKLIHNSNFFCYDIEKYIYFVKIRQIIGYKFK